MGESSEIQKRLLEMIVICEEYTPKLENVNLSIDRFTNLLQDQKYYQDENSQNQKSWLDDLKTTSTNLIDKSNSTIIDIKKNIFNIYAILFLLLSFVSGFFISLNFSEKYFFSDHRLKIIHELEAENLNTRKQYLYDIKLLETLRENGCIISYEMLLAPKYIVKQTGKSEDGKFKGVWFKKNM